MKRRIFGIVLTLLLLVTLSLSAMAASPTLTASQAQGAAGETVDITVSVANNPGVWGMDVKIGYDANAMTLTSVANGTVFAANERTEGNINGNPYILSYECAAFSNTTNNGTLATMTFTVKNDAAPGSYDITVSCTKGNAINVDEEDVLFQTVNGSVTVQNSEPETSGTCGKESGGANLSWEVADNTLTISGTGAMADYTASTAPWQAFCTTITNVVVKQGVTTIGNYAFSGCTALTDVIFEAAESGPALMDAESGSLTSIGDGAFSGCDSLEDVTIPDTVTSLGDGAFSGCDALKNVTIPASVTEIGTGVFSNCPALEEVYFAGTQEQWAALGEDILPNTVTPHCCPTEYAFSLMPEKNIDIGFYVKVAHGAAIDGYAVAATFDGEETVNRALTASDFVDTDSNGYDRYRMIVGSAYAYEMTKLCAVTVTHNGEEVKSVTDYSVQKYCTNKLADQDASEPLKALCTAMLDYGGNAQLYFNGKTYYDGDTAKVYDAEPANRANLTTNPTNTVSLGEIDLTGYTGSKTGTLENVSATLLLGSETSLKFYFSAATAPSSATAQIVGGDAVPTSAIKDEGTGMYSVKIPNIKACELFEKYSITIGDTTIDYSPMSYVKNHLDDESSALCTAFAVYANAASELLG